MIEVTAAGRVRRILLNRPGKRNALNLEMCRDLVRAFEDANDDPAAGAILLTATGPAFCAGMDLEEALAGDSPELGSAHERTFTLIDRARKPVIAAVQGPALGGGTGLVANAHIVVVSPEARFGLTEIRVGLWPVLIMRAVVLAMGERRATELSLTGRIFGAEQALAYGLASEISNTAYERALEIAEAAAAQSPLAMEEGLAYTRQLRASRWKDTAEDGWRVRERLMSSPEFKARAGHFAAGRDLRGKSL